MMLGIDRSAARYTWTAAAVLLLLWLVYLVRSTLFIFVLALLFAYLLSPLVDLLDRFLPVSRTRTRTPALAMAYVIFVATVVIVGVQIVPRVVEQATALKERFPKMVASWQQPAPAPAESGTVSSIKAQVLDTLRTQVAARSSDLIGTLPEVGLKFLSVASDLIFVVIIPVLAFFFLKDGNQIREHILSLVDGGPRRALLDDLLADVNVLLAAYMRALVLLALSAFTAYSIFFAVVGVPYGILLAALACLLEFIPMVGPLAASLIILLVAGLSGAPIAAILIFLAAYRMLQDYVVSPHLMGHGVELHPLLVLFGVFGGAEVAGIAGTFLSVPVLALARIVYLHIRKARISAGVAVRQ
ncbi:MAG TPA: AI-2E family transporter [Candidatus Acidoferrales bacterium]|nr:AI-2E family transporter [Candidatus Acidoferrales bacterium]